MDEYGGIHRVATIGKDGVIPTFNQLGTEGMLQKPSFWSKFTDCRGPKLFGVFLQVHYGFD